MKSDRTQDELHSVWHIIDRELHDKFGIGGILILLTGLSMTKGAVSADEYSRTVCAKA